MALLKNIRAEAPEAIFRILDSFRAPLLGLGAPNPQKHDPLNGMDRNDLLRCVFEKKSIVCRVEVSFQVSGSRLSLVGSYPVLRDGLRAGDCIVEIRRKEKRGMAKGMTKDQIALATKLGGAGRPGRGGSGGRGEGLESMKAVKGDLFACARPEWRRIFWATGSPAVPLRNRR